MTGDPEPAAPAAGIRERLWAAANVVAPTSVVTTLLFYFGYVATTARFGYFGVYLDMVDLSFQEMLLYGAEVVYPPLIILAIVSLLAAATHTAVRWLTSQPRRDPVTGWVGLFVTLAGLLGFSRGVVGLLVPDVARTETIATTPVTLGAGALAFTYGLWLLRLVGIRWDLGRTAADHDDDTNDSNGTDDTDEDPPEPSAAPPRAGELAAWLQSTAFLRGSRYALAWVAVIVVAGSFWTANSFAAAYGRGRALDDAASLPRRPEVVLYTKDPLDDLPDGVQQSPIPGAAKNSFRYRCTGLRLLVESNSRLFLVPGQWMDGVSRTLVVPYDDTIRVELVAG